MKEDTESSESKDFNAIKTEPRSQKCRKLLHEMISAISSKISSEGGLLHKKPELYHHTQNLISGNLLETFNYAFETLEIANKLDYIEELSRESSTKLTAWRPVAGDVDTSGIQKRCLSIRKQYLQKQLESLDEETKKMKQLIVEKRKMIEHNQLELDKLCIS